MTRALERVSLEIERGTTVAFVGPSGCGKSTLLKLIAGLVRPTKGAITVDGLPIAGPSKNVGMAFQNPVLLPWRTVLDNLLLPLEILRENRDPRAPARALWRERASALLATVGLAGAALRQPRELSGGMRQRLSLCRALIHEPALLLLDEQFAALDAFTREEMWELHQKLRLQREFTGVLVTHDLREAVFLAQTIYVMSAGPGRIDHVHRVGLGVPRTLGQLYGAEATALIRDMREQIRPGRRAVA
ncbi:MAG TPA: ABC transporter ATP-binding protein [Methylomirabilota bacterium]|nr:ABC transporter ATP-binding protein [Methylomirabilota bacterium]